MMQHFSTPHDPKYESGRGTKYIVPHSSFIKTLKHCTYELSYSSQSLCTIQEHTHA
jgi:hypothetical protein